MIPFTFAVGLFSGDPIDPIIIVIDQDQREWNLWDELGGRRDAMDITVIVNADVTVAGLTTGDMPGNPNTKIKIVNYGKIYGLGGKGGDGGVFSGTPASPNGRPGERGGAAITTVNFDISIENYGEIYGGGGGGGGAVGGDFGANEGYWYVGGGGGGGGAMFGSGGKGGKNPIPSDGKDGPDGSNSSGTTGGAGGNDPDYELPGGKGGNVGQPGAIGRGWPQVGGGLAGGGPGGAVGPAVKTNGNSVIWLAGFTPEQVKGLVEA